MLERLMLWTLVAIAVCAAAPMLASYMQAALPTLVGFLVMLAMVRLALPPRRRR
jgi:hypothetical protein